MNLVLCYYLLDSTMYYFNILVINWVYLPKTGVWEVSLLPKVEVEQIVSSFLSKFLA